MCAAATWGYDKHNGPSVWHQNFPKAAGKRQSPINIVSGSCQSHSYSHPLKVDYSPEANLEVTNNGFTFLATIKGENSICGGPLETTPYKLHSFHFHWGSDDSHGSEHTIDEKAYPAELHLVHWNYTKYPDFAEAAAAEDGLSVLGIFLKVGEHSAILQVLCDAMDKVQACDSKHTLPEPFDLPSLVDGEHSGDAIQFYTYPGSLTTPPCHESVTWLVSKNMLSCSSEQLTHFRNLIGKNSAPLVDNYRPVLDVGNRCVCSCK